FYRLARSEAVEGWVRQTPSSFLFTVKASRYLTHVKRLRGIEEGIRRFYEPLAPLIEAGRLGPVLWQLPENFHRDDERLEGWLSLLPEGMHTIEFRHESWFAAPVMRMLKQHGVALTIGDHPKRPFQSLEATAARRELLGDGDRGVGPADRAVAPPRGRVRLLQQRLERLRPGKRPAADGQARPAKVNRLIHRVHTTYSVNRLI